jgi:methyl-accepting chemotaxis protein
MNSKTKPGELPLGDQIDRIANHLPADLRADYYREMMYCRSLPENDEMLRILRVMQYLTLLTVEIPDRVVTERERLEQLFKATVDSLDKIVRSNEAYRKQLDSRISHFPEEILKHLTPGTIAARINESLQQQFATSTLPQSARELALLAREVKATTNEFKETAGSLSDAYRGAATDARRSIEEMKTTISTAANVAKHAAQELTDVFRREYRWSVYVLSGLALVIGLILGILFDRWLDSPATVIERGTPAIQSIPEITPQSRPKR